MDIPAAEGHYRKFCEALGIDLTKPDTLGTPERVVRMFHKEFLQGLGDSGDFFRFTAFPAEDEQRDQLVMETGIRFVSLCAHHHLPIIGTAHVGYLPNEKLAGLSKLARAVKWVARKPTVQETLLSDVRNIIIDNLSPRFVGVSIAGSHQCMACRGVMEPGALMINNTFWVNPDARGEDGESTTHKADYESTKQEFFRAIDHWFKYTMRTP